MEGAIYFKDYETEEDWHNAKYQLQIEELARLNYHTTKEKLEENDFKYLESFNKPWRTAKRIEIVIYAIIGFYGEEIISRKELLSVFEKFFGYKISTRSLSVALTTLRNTETIITRRIGNGQIEYSLNDCARWVPAYIKKHGLKA